MFHPPVDNPLFPLLICHLVLLKHSTGEGEGREEVEGGGRIERGRREGEKREKERREGRGGR